MPQLRQMEAPIPRPFSFRIAILLPQIRRSFLGIQRRRTNDLYRSTNLRRRVTGVIEPAMEMDREFPVVLVILLAVRPAPPPLHVQNQKLHHHLKINTLMSNQGLCNSRFRFRVRVRVPVIEQRSYQVHTQRSGLYHRGNPYLLNLCEKSRQHNHPLIGPVDHRREVVVIIIIDDVITMSDGDHIKG